jgi:hypothetical protein
MEWGLEPIDAETHKPANAPHFEPGFDPLILDFLLVGQDEGPLAVFLARGATACDHPIDMDWSTHVCPPAVIPPGAVCWFRSQLSAIDPSNFAPPEALRSAGWLRGYSPTEQQTLYDGLVACAEELRRFIAETAEAGFALRCHMH